MRPQKECRSMKTKTNEGCSYRDYVKAARTGLHNVLGWNVKYDDIEIREGSESKDPEGNSTVDRVTFNIIKNGVLCYCKYDHMTLIVNDVEIPYIWGDGKL